MNRSILRGLCSLLVVASALPFAGIARAQTAVSDWTLLIYVNGKNNLEGAAITDFYEMAEIGSTQSVQVVAQVGRPKKHYSNAEGAWSGVYRFHVKKGQIPRPEHAVFDVQKAGLTTDMADPKTVEDFVRWGTQQYPAKRTMLVIWNHGQGQRFQLEAQHAVRLAGSRAARSAADRQLLLSSSVSADGSTAGHRAISSDDDSRQILYNRQLQDVLEKLAGESIRLDVVGFDACLMSMIETAYAMRKSASYMVASEELEPGNGWNYRTLLTSLTSAPKTDALELSRMIVNAYKDHYRDGDRTTLSAIDLARVEPLAQALSSVSLELLNDLSIQRPLIEKTRKGTASFADWDQPPMRTSIDLKLFLTRLAVANPNAAVKDGIAKTLALLDTVVVENYRASPVTNGGYGGNGLAIYFPRDRATWNADRFNDGYLADNKKFPLEIVTSPTTSGWAKLVRGYLGVP